MNDSVFGEMYFDIGWYKHDTICLWGVEHSILIKAKAYFEHEKITDAQRVAYNNFSQNKKDIETTIEKLLACIEDSQIHLKPTLMLFEKDGRVALLLDDDTDPDDGIAVQLSPEEKVMSQDSYL